VEAGKEAQPRAATEWKSDLMQSTPTPRLEYVEAQWAHGVLAALEQDRTDILADATASRRELTQVEYALLAEDCKDIGMLKYALGLPLDETHEALAEATEAYLQVFALRGTQAAFEVAVVTDGEAKPLREPGATDVSLTNSRRGLRAMYVALIAKGETIAREIAAHVWDPPGATYIGTESEVCTPDDQQLAYAMKALLLGKKSEALSLLPAPPVSSFALMQTELIKMLSAGRKEGFMAGLTDLLAWHRWQIADAENRKNIDLFFSVPGLALCRYALGCGLTERGELPGQTVFLPLDLLANDVVKPA
jgi:hypothetical protein